MGSNGEAPPVRSDAPLPPMPTGSAQTLHDRLPGRQLGTNERGAWNDLVVQIYARTPVETGVLVPAVAEPLIVWILKGAAFVEERDLGGDWSGVVVEAGDFFLTRSPAPYELRWRSLEAGAPFEVMHLYLGLEVLRRAADEVGGRIGAPMGLLEVSGGRDPVLSGLLEPLRLELSATPPSPLLVAGLAQALAVHLCRRYGDPDGPPIGKRSALPAYRLRRALHAMEAGLDRPFDLGALAREAGFSPFHFSRLFKSATGLTPSRYFMRLRLALARRLLRETDKPIIEIGLEVGYSSPSHFAQVFRREVGVTPRDYRG